METILKNLLIILALILLFAVIVAAENAVFDDTDHNGYDIYGVGDLTAERFCIGDCSRYIIVDGEDLIIK